MRLAGGPEIYQALVQHFSSDKIPSSAAEHLAAEVMAHGAEANTRIETFFRLYELLQSKGYSEPASQHLAVEMMEGREPMAQETRRFSGTYDDECCDPGAYGSPY
jgi:hypothetical protein